MRSAIDVLADDPGSWTMRDARLVIAYNVGLNTSLHTPFGLRDLNSIYAYLTGEWFFDKRDYWTTRSPSPWRIRKAIAFEVGIDYDPGPTRDRAFKRDSLVKLAQEIDRRSDKRPRPPARRPK